MRSKISTTEHFDKTGYGENEEYRIGSNFEMGYGSGVEVYAMYNNEDQQYIGQCKGAVNGRGYISQQGGDEVN